MDPERGCTLGREFCEGFAYVKTKGETEGEKISKEKGRTRPLRDKKAPLFFRGEKKKGDRKPRKANAVARKKE